MIIQTNELTENVTRDSLQISKRPPLVMLGSATKNKYVTDIDFSLFTNINETYIRHLRNSLRHSRSFIFLYMNAGVIKDYDPPWEISTVEGCEFNLDRAMHWVERLDSTGLIDIDMYEKIKAILTRESLKMADLIEIDYILDGEKNLRWFYDDIMRGEKTVLGTRYVLLDEMRKNYSPVLNLFYIYKNDYVSVDVGIVDRKIKRDIEGRLNPYYTKNWYKILKGFKKGILPKYKSEYEEVITSLNYDNAVFARVDLLERSAKYGILSEFENARLDREFRKEFNKSPEEMREISIQNLNEKSEPYVKYFVNKLRPERETLRTSKLKLLTLADTPTSRAELVRRQEEEGIRCPFFTREREYILELSRRVSIDKDRLYNCFYFLKEEYDLDISEALYFFSNIPANRLYIEQTKSELLVKGNFLPIDIAWMEANGGASGGGGYVFDKRALIKVQLYLIKRNIE